MKDNSHVRATFLSKKPRKNSRLITALTFLGVSAFSLAYWENWGGWAKELPAIQRQVFEYGEWERLFTAQFIHADMAHYLGNLGPLLILSFLLYGYFGWWVFPIGTVLLGALVNGLSILTYPPEVRLLGASGLVYGMGAFWLTLFILVERTHGIGGRLLRAMGFFLVFFAPASLEPGVSYRTHGIAFGVGLVAALLYFLVHFRRIRAEEVWQTDTLPALEFPPPAAEEKET